MSLLKVSIAPIAIEKFQRVFLISYSLHPKPLRASFSEWELSSSLIASYVLSPLFGPKGLADRTEHGLKSPELFTTLLNYP